MNEPGTDGRDSIIGLAKEPSPVVSTTERVEMSADVSDCAFEAIVIGNGGFGSTMSKLGITLVDGCWAALGDGGLGSTTSESGIALVNGCRSRAASDAGRFGPNILTLGIVSVEICGHWATRDASGST